MATANLGRVGFVNKGTYSGATAYKVNDVVTYNTGTYACIQANTGQAPTNTSYWQNWIADNAVHKTGDETIAGAKTFSDNVGIGESSPYNKLEVGGAGVFSGTRVDSGNAGVVIDWASTFGRVIARTANMSNYANLQICAIDSIFINGGYERARIDAAGNFLLTGGSGGLGYGTGSGGTVTQLTSKSTNVTLNKPSGQITMHNASFAAGATVSFQFNNSLLTSKDSIEITIDGSSMTLGYDLYDIRKTILNGYAIITLVNRHIEASAEAVRLNFNVIKGSIN